MYKEICMLILNTYLTSGTRPKFSVYIPTGITKWFVNYAVRYSHTSKPHKLYTSYLSNWELLQRVSAKKLIKVSKYEVV